MRNYRVLSLALVLVLAACSKSVETGRVGIDPKPEVKAPGQIQQSFAVVSSGLGISGASHISIQKTSLDKEFLLTASIIPQAGAPTSSGLQGRVVAFKQYGDSVYLMEATQGHVVTRDLPATLILAEIPVVKEETDSLVLDFNEGMKKVYLAGNWYASDYDGANYSPEAMFMSADVDMSVITSMGFENNTLEIRQIAQVQLPSFFGTVSTPVETRYFISAYQPNPAYQPQETSDFKLVGYFEAAPLLEETSGRGISRITKWDMAQPITYHVSANTPPEFVNAVKEGILYWNKAYGRDVVRAETAPAGATAPDHRYNIVQWVPWDQAGFAYADALMDPRSGEIMHGQVYMTSAFAVGSKKRASMMLRKLRSFGERADRKLPRFGMTILGSARLCDLEVSARFADALEKVIASGADDAAILRVSQDYVRLVIAHEIGHTLGLRHNFAGSLASNVSLSERDRLFKEYLLEEKIPDPRSVTFSSSVMEYAVFEEDVLMGRQMEQLDAAFDYDMQAIRWGYMGREMKRGATALFCTDSHAESYADCLRFDAGPSPVKFASETIQAAFKDMAKAVAEKFIQAKSPWDPRDAQDVSEVNLDPAAQAGLLLQLYKTQLAWFAPQVKSVAVERKFPYAGPLNAADIQKERMSWVSTQVTELGGVDQALLSYLPATDRAALPIASAAVAELDAYLARADVRNGIDVHGKPYALSNNEIETIKKMGAQYFAAVEAAFRKGVLDTLTAAVFAEPTTSPAVELRLAAVAEQVILEQTQDTVEGKANVYAQSKAMRLAAAGMLAGSKGVYADWTLEARIKIRDKISETIEKSLGAKNADVDQMKLSRPLRLWLMDQREILAKLGV